MFLKISKNRKEIVLEEIVDNLTGDKKIISSDYLPKTREEILLLEIEKNTRNLGGNNQYTMWVGTQEEYENIDAKNENTLYFIKESE